MNLFEDRLDTLSYQEVVEAISAIGAETQRLEFKASIARKQLAHKVCSFANAMGGVIVIGIEDPKIGGEALRPSKTPIDACDKAGRSLTSTINSFVFPTPSFEIRAVIESGSAAALLIVRISPSMNGPCEFLS